MKIAITLLAVLALTLSISALTQVPDPSASTTYQPKFAGDKAHSNSEAAALGYMRTIVSAQKVYKQKHGIYAKSLAGLVGSGSFTRRMVEAKRGDYTAIFKPRSQGYALTMAPQQLDSDHRSFYVDESGTFRASENAEATAASPALK